MFPRCGIPDHLADWAEYEQFVRFLIATGSIREHTEIWWSVRPHQAFPTVETRICDAQPEFGQAVGAGGADGGADRAVRAPLRRRRGRCPHTHRASWRRTCGVRSGGGWTAS